MEIIQVLALLLPLLIVYMYLLASHKLKIVAEHKFKIKKGLNIIYVPILNLIKYAEMAMMNEGFAYIPILLIVASFPLLIISQSFEFVLGLGILSFITIHTIFLCKIAKRMGYSAWWGLSQTFFIMMVENEADHIKKK